MPDSRHESYHVIPLCFAGIDGPVRTNPRMVYRTSRGLVDFLPLRLLGVLSGVGDHAFPTGFFYQGRYTLPKSEC